MVSLLPGIRWSTRMGPFQLAIALRFLRLVAERHLESRDQKLKECP
jgi:hypothetical protein